MKMEKASVGTVSSTDAFLYFEGSIPDASICGSGVRDVVDLEGEEIFLSLVNAEVSN